MKVNFIGLQIVITIEAFFSRHFLYSLLSSMTLTAPIQSLQQASNKPILSRGFSFQFFSATSSSQPSGMRPSKNGNMIGLLMDLSESGMVRLIGSGLSNFR